LVSIGLLFPLLAAVAAPRGVARATLVQPRLFAAWRAGDVLPARIGSPPNVTVAGPGDRRR
jgi:hypothetical protein